MSVKTTTLGLSASLFILTTSAFAQQQTYFGEDEGLGESVRLMSSPNADAARDDFLAAINGPRGTENFESFTDGDIAPLVIMFGVETATLNAIPAADASIVTILNPLDTNGFGRYPISGTNFWDTFKDFSIAFSRPVTAFGFYAVDIGDFNSQLSLTLTGPDITLDVPHEIGAERGSILYFGVRSVQPFTGVSFANSVGQDKFAFDDFTVAVDPQIFDAVDIPVNHPLALLLAALLMGGLGLRYQKARV